MKNYLKNLNELFDVENAENIDEIKNFPVNIFSAPQDYKPIFSAIEQIKSNFHKIEDEPKLENSPIHSTVCNKILAYFILDHSNELDIESFEELCAFTCLYAKALNEYGYVTVDKLFKEWNVENKLDTDGDFCEKNNGLYILEICNEYIDTYLPLYLKNTLNDNKNFKILIGIENELDGIISLLLIFADWLKKKCFTSSKLTLN